MNWLQNIDISSHFIERYFQRVLMIDLPSNYDHFSAKTKVFKDLISRLTENEIICGNSLCFDNHMVKIPFEQTKLIIVKDNTLVTVISNNRER